MLRIKNSLTLLVLIGTTVPSSLSLADGLTDLQQALARLEGTSPIRATLTNTFTEQRGEGKELKQQQGSVAVSLTDHGNGLHITYSPAVMNAMEHEAEQKLTDEEAPTPTLDAVNDLEASKLKSTLSAATSLKRFILKASHTSEETADYQGKQVRLLHFDLPLEAVISSPKVRDYVNHFDGQYQVWIDDSGIPLKSEITFSGKGRAFIFFTMQAEAHTLTYYEVAGNRLVIVDKEYRNAYDSSWDTSQTQGTETLVLHRSEDHALMTQCDTTAGRPQS